MPLFTPSRSSLWLVVWLALFFMVGNPNGLMAQDGVLASKDANVSIKPDLADALPPEHSMEMRLPPLKTNDESEQIQGMVAQSVDWLKKTITPPAVSQDAKAFSFLGGAVNQRSTIKTAATLTLLVSLFLLVMYLLKIRKPNGKKNFPADLVSVLGQTQLGPSQKLQLIRLGTKLLLVSNGPQGTQTLGEITDPEEVFRIEVACREGNWPGLSRVLQQKMERQRQMLEKGLSRGERAREEASHRTLLEA